MIYHHMSVCVCLDGLRNSNVSSSASASSSSAKTLFHVAHGAPGVGVTLPTAMGFDEQHPGDLRRQRSQTKSQPRGFVWFCGTHSKRDIHLTTQIHTCIYIYDYILYIIYCIYTYRESDL